MDNTKDITRNICKCCDGTGVQVRNDGIKIRCPACGGTGKWNTWEVTWESPIVPRTTDYDPDWRYATKHICVGGSRQ